MRVALLHPTYWPEVRRGSERLAHDLGAALAARGHEVTLITTHRARPRTAVEDGIRVVRGWRPPRVGGLHTYEEHVTTIPHALARLARGRFDLAHALYPTDGWAALRARRLGGPPYVLSIHGIVNRPYLVARRYRLEMLAVATAGAGAVSVLSEAAREPFRRYLMRDPVVLPGGVDRREFEGDSGAREGAPTLLCPAALGDYRKRGPLLLAAFERLRRSRPDARLVLAGGRDPYLTTERVGSTAGVERVALDGTGELAAAYGRAWVTVLPAVEEAFGLVLLESLAAGTPAVAARSGACPEILADPRVGRLFEPDEEADLTRAMHEALELAGEPDTAAACRAAVAAWDWSRIVERYEDVYREVLEAEAGGAAQHAPRLAMGGDPPGERPDHRPRAGSTVAGRLRTRPRGGANAGE